MLGNPGPDCDLEPYQIARYCLRVTDELEKQNREFLPPGPKPGTKPDNSTPMGTPVEAWYIDFGGKEYGHTEGRFVCACESGLMYIQHGERHVGLFANAKIVPARAERE